MNKLKNYIQQLIESDAEFSDIQIESGCEVMWRLPSGWADTGYGIVETEEMSIFLADLSREWKSLLATGHAINKTLPYANSRMRISAYTVRSNTRHAMTIRVLPAEVPTLESLKLPIQVAQFASVPKGLLLVAGATGVGKTTTIASLVSRINEQRNAHIITIEEPIEYLHERKKSIVTQRETGEGHDVKSYPQGVYEALRQCPDVIVIGEIRDSATAEAALYAAESGHYVMATLHAKSSIGAIQKFLSFFPDESRVAKASMLAGTLCGVLFQSRLASIDEKRTIIATEILSSIEGEISGAIADPGRIRSLEDKLKTGQLKGGIHINQSLKQMLDNGEVSKRAAMGASYCPEGLV